MIFKALAIFGGIVVAAAAIRAYKQSKAGVKPADAAKAELNTLTNFGGVILVLLSIGLGLYSMYELSHPSGSGGPAMAVLLGSIAASVQGTFNLTYVPQFIGFTVTSAPTFMQINMQGDGLIFNLDATGQTAMKNIRQVANISNVYVYQIASGLINGKNGTLTITNAAAAQLDVYGWSFDRGDMYCTYNSQNALASSGIQLNDFAYAAFPSLAANDVINVTWASGITQTLNRLELQYGLVYKQNNASGIYNIDNIDPANVSQLTLNPVAAQNVYVMQYQSAKGAVSSAVNSIM